MKRIIIILSFFFYANIYAQKDQNPLMPLPFEIEYLNGSYTISKSTTISVTDIKSRKIGEMLISKIAASTGYHLSIEDGMEGDIRLIINKVADETLGSEGYMLQSNSRGVELSANQPAGLFYGLQTLLQLLPDAIESNQVAKASWKLPSVKIIDYPRFGWRGLMLDVSRHFFTKEEVEDYIDLLSQYKFNTFHWHLTDDNGWRIEIKSLPKLTGTGAWRVARYGQFGEFSLTAPGEPATYGGFYTQQEIKEIIQFANERYVTIIPEIDVPGHCMAAIASYPYLCCTKDSSITVNPGTPFSEWYADGTFKMLIDNTLNPSDEKVYQFLDKVFTEVADLFPGQYIHVGGDECYKGYWENDPGCQDLMKKLKLSKVSDLQVYFMNRVDEILKKKGKKLLGWDDDGELLPGATVMGWRGFKGGIDAAQKGHDVVMTPTQFCYLDYQQGESTIEPPVYASLRLKNCYSFEPVPEGVDAKYILGGQGNLWTENIPTFRHVQYMIFPRAWALSEALWSPKELRNWNDFIKRVELQFKRADIKGVNYSHAIYDPVITSRKMNDKLYVIMESEASGVDLFYTIDGTMPDNFSPKYSGLIALPAGPITLRVMAYRDGKSVGHLITLKREELERRIIN